MNQDIYCKNHTIYYGNFELIYNAKHKKLSITKFNQNMSDFKDCPEDRYESHVEWFETYEKKDISKCYYLPKEVINLVIEKGLEYEKHQREEKDKKNEEFQTNSLKEDFFEALSNIYTKERMKEFILKHQKNGKEKYNIDLPGVEYYEELLNKYWN